MANNRKKDKTVRAFAVVAGVLCAGALAGGGYISTVRGEHFGAERVVKADISSFEELAALGEGAYNDTISLRGDIRITDGDFMVGEGAQPFCGTFDGHGYTGYCDISSAAEGASSAAAGRACLCSAPSPKRAWWRTPISYSAASVRRAACMRRSPRPISAPSATAP